MDDDRHPASTERDGQSVVEMQIQLDLDDRASELASEHRLRGRMLVVGAVTTGASWIASWLAVGPTHFFTLGSLAIFLFVAILAALVWFAWGPLAPPELAPVGHDDAPLLRSGASSAPLGDAILVDLYLPIDRTTVFDFPVVPAGDDLFTIARIPTPLESRHLKYRDIVALRRLPSGTYALERIHARAGWSEHDALLSAEFAASQELADLLEEVVRRGGVWTRYFGGCLAVAMPRGSALKWDFQHHLEEAITSFSTGPAT